MTTSTYPNLHTTKHHGKVVWITGGNSGIGLATAQRMAREGAQVVISGRRQAALDAAVAAIGHGAQALRGDVAAAEDMQRIARTIAAEHGRIDIVFANAGVADFTALDDITTAQFNRTFDINVRGTLHTVQAALPHMPKGSAMVINGSICGIQGVPAFGVYAASKAALRSFVRTFSVDLKGRGIRINAVAPGVVITPAYQTELKLTDAQIAAYCDQIAEQAPLGRVGEADEIAKAVSFLASDDASYITGTELFVDGGLAQI